MNRMQHWLKTLQHAPGSSSHCDDPARAEHGLVHRATSGSHPCALFAPLHYEPNYAYPLLVWLHGPGDDERQLQRIMPMISMRNYVAIAPRGRQAIDGASGYSWSQTDQDIVSAAHRVFESIDQASCHYHTDAKRVFVAGFRCGGTMAMRIGLKYPDRFAGVLSLCGAFPEGKSPLARLDDARELPLFMTHGCDSLDFAVDRTCYELRLFHAAGMNVSLRQYSCGDDLHPQMLHDMDGWMMRLVTGIPSGNH